MTTEPMPPERQYAVQLVGPGELELNRDKKVPRPGAHQMVGQVEAVGLCFSDLKLLKQFAGHARKSEVTEGLKEDVLEEIPSYVPGGAPTVPGHEALVRIVAAGEQVRHHEVGKRYLVQADYRHLRTEGASAGFGYNFEGALQQYVLMDERVVMTPEGESLLIEVDGEPGASEVALVEPWACVEDSYVNSERPWLKAGGQLLVVAEAGRRLEGIEEAFEEAGIPAGISGICADGGQQVVLEGFGAPVTLFGHITDLPDHTFDDIIYFGADAQAIEAMDAKLAQGGMLNIVTGGEKVDAPVSMDLGRVHYGMTRWIGTNGHGAAEAYAHIPMTGEVRDGDRVLVVGAGGPMGQMHVIRNICSGRKHLSIYASDFDDARLAALEKKARPLAEACGVRLRVVNPQKEQLDERFTYIALMAPLAGLVAEAVRNSAPGCLVNIFAGIPAGTRHELDLDTYIAHRCFMFGTSGSTLEDMRIVLGKVAEGQLDTNTLVDAVSGMAGAIKGIQAIEERSLAGKIIVYPALAEMGMIPLEELEQHYPTVAQKLKGGVWTKEAEAELLRVAAS